MCIRELLILSSTIRARDPVSTDHLGKGDGCDAQPFRPGDRLVASVALEHGALPVWADLYAGFVLPNGQIYLLTGAGLSTELSPLISPMLLTTGLISRAAH